MRVIAKQAQGTFSDDVPGSPTVRSRGAADRFAGLPMAQAALEFASTRHADQYREIDRAPFIAHPIEVGSLLHCDGQPDEVIAAGLLHDVLEKTATTSRQLRRRFGARIARLVELVSDDPSIGDYEKRKRQLRDRLAPGESEALAIFAADKISKVRELALLPPWRLYKTTTRAKLTHYQASLEMLRRVAGDLALVDRLDAELNRLVSPAITRTHSARAITTTVPSEHTTGQQRRLGSITKTGSTHARRLLVEAAWHYRKRPRIGTTLTERQAGQPPEPIAIAWSAQRRLHRTWTRPVRRRPPLDDEHRGFLVEVGVHDPSAMSAWKRSPSAPSVIGPAAIARPEILASPGHCASEPSTGSTVALCKANRGSRRRSAPLRAFGIAKNQLAILEDRLDPGDPRRPVGSRGGNCLVSVSVEQPPYALSELRLCLFDVLPCRHTPMFAPMTDSSPRSAQRTRSRDNRRRGDEGNRAETGNRALRGLIDRFVWPSHAPVVNRCKPRPRCKA